MRYLGGKAKSGIAISIGAIIDEIQRRERRACYLEPFIGGLSVTTKIRSAFPRRVLADGCLDLVLLYRAIAQGWVPPSDINENEYNRLRVAPPSALRGFVGFGCSHSGRFFGGFAFDARDDKRYFAIETRRALLRDRACLVGAELVHADYRAHRPVNALVYCDPPYRGTAGYKEAGEFNSGEFWETVRGWSAAGNTVLVSEYEAPVDFERVWTRDVKVYTKRSAGRAVLRMESLWRYRG